MTAAHRLFRRVASAAAVLGSFAFGSSLPADPVAPMRGMSLFDEPAPAARESVPRVSSPFYQAPGDAVRRPDSAAAAGVPSQPAQSSNRPVSLTTSGGIEIDFPGRSTVPVAGEAALPAQTEPEVAKQSAAAADVVDYDSLTAPDRPSSPRPRRVAERAPEPATSSGWGTVAYYGGLVLGLAVAGYVAAWGVRRQTLPARTGLPDGLLEHVGSRTLAPQTTLHIVRVGTRLLILGHTPQGLQTLSEIDDPERVSQLMSLSEVSGGEARNLFRRNRSTSGGNEASVARSGVDQQG